MSKRSYNSEGGWGSKCKMRNISNIISNYFDVANPASVPKFVLWTISAAY
jgi:hypothetical protein